MNTTELPSIPDIAELIRLHTHRSNDTARLVAEHILPIFGVELEKPTDLANLMHQLENTRTMEHDMAELLKEVKSEVSSAYDALAEHDRATDGLPQHSHAPEGSTLDDYHGDLAACKEHAWTVRQCIDSIGGSVSGFEQDWSLS
jgi:hypothetical protein